MYKYPTALALVKPDMVIIYLDTSLAWAKWMMLVVVLGIVLASVISFGAVFAILRTLRKNARSFSARTYRLHLQLTVLLLAQVCNDSFSALAVICHPDEDNAGLVQFPEYTVLNSSLGLETSLNLRLCIRSSPKPKHELTTRLRPKLKLSSTLNLA